MLLRGEAGPGRRLGTGKKGALHRQRVEAMKAPRDGSIFWAGPLLLLLLWPSYFALRKLDVEQWLYVLLAVAVASIPIAVLIQAGLRRSERLRAWFPKIAYVSWCALVLSAVVLILVEGRR